MLWPGSEGHGGAFGWWQALQQHLSTEVIRLGQLAVKCGWGGSVGPACQPQCVGDHCSVGQLPAALCPLPTACALCLMQHPQ